MDNVVGLGMSVNHFQMYEVKITWACGAHVMSIPFISII